MYIKRNLNIKKAYDIVIIGGGIHGASLANQASQLGISVLLADKSDFAAETSSRSSKMAHGGLRYLEMFDFNQVFEGIKSRDLLLEKQSALVKPQKFLIPVYSNWFYKYKILLGLFFYDLLLKNKKLKHKVEDLNNYKDLINIFPKDSKLSDLILYYDGTMDDSLIVVEHIRKATKQGADCFNHLKAEILNNSEDFAEVKLIDQTNEQEFFVKAKKIINLAGPFVGEIDPTIKKQLMFSFGVHIIFDYKWEFPALFLPLNKKTRYYFVWPFKGKTMIGTTERKFDKPVTDPQPTKDEIQEILNRVKKDIPNSNLNKDNILYAFSGLRTLALRDSKSTTGKISRKHLLVDNKSIISLLGGKYTTANYTSFEILKKLIKEKKIIESEKKESQKKEAKLKDKKIDYSLDSVLGTKDLEEKIKICLKEYYVVSFMDLANRIGLVYFNNNGLDDLEDIKDIIIKEDKSFPVEQGLREFKEHIEAIKKIIQS